MKFSFNKQTNMIELDLSGNVIKYKNDAAIEFDETFEKMLGDFGINIIIENGVFKSKRKKAKYNQFAIKVPANTKENYFIDGEVTLGKVKKGR